MKIPTYITIELVIEAEDMDAAQNIVEEIESDLENTLFRFKKFNSPQLNEFDISVDALDEADIMKE